MHQSISTVLNKTGLYKPAFYWQRYLTDRRFRLRENEIRSDLRSTRHQISTWSKTETDVAPTNGTFAISSFTIVPFYAKLHGILAKSMQLEGYKPIVFTNSGLRHSHEYYRLFGIQNIVMWDQFVLQAQTGEVHADEVYDELVGNETAVTALADIRFRGVEIGKHALSMTCRKLVEGQLDLKDSRTGHLFKDEFVRAVQNVIAAENYLDAHPFDKLIVRDLGYTPHAQLFEVALQRGIDCMVHEFGYRKGTWIFKRYLPKIERLHLFSLSDTTWQGIKESPWSEEMDQKLMAELNERYAADSQSDLRRLNAGKQNMSPEQVIEHCGLDPSKKTAVIFSHLAWDAAFFFGTCIFGDFETWLFETVKYVAEHCPDMNWIVKLHPYNAFKLQREDKIEESEMRLLRSLFPLPDHVKIMRSDTSVSTQALFPLVDYVLTVNGTVGMEFPCFGIPALVAGTGRYDGRGFTIDATNVNEYYDILRELHHQPRLTAAATLLARKHYGSLMLRRQTDLSDIAPMQINKYHEAQSEVHNNITINAKSLQQFAQSDSIQRLRQWLAHSQAEDLLEPI